MVSKAGLGPQVRSSTPLDPVVVVGVDRVRVMQVEVTICGLLGGTVCETVEVNATVIPMLTVAATSTMARNLTQIRVAVSIFGTWKNERLRIKGLLTIPL